MADPVKTPQRGDADLMVQFETPLNKTPPEKDSKLPSPTGSGIDEDFFKGLEDLDSKRELEEMKARAGHDLVHEVTSRGGETVKLLYLTNGQASAIASDETSVQVLLEKLCGERKRDLVIDLVHSWGFKKSTLLYDKDSFNNDYSKFCAGIQYNTSPFGDKNRDEMLSLGRLDDFMERIIIPLAETTKATILCHAVSDYCILTESLLKTYRQLSSKWRGNPPFAMIGMIGSIEPLYFNDNTENPKKDQVWSYMMKGNGHWKTRHEKFLDKTFKFYDDAYKKKRGFDRNREHDLNWTTKRILIVEGLDTDVLLNEMEREKIEEKEMYNLEIVRKAKNWTPFSDLKSAIIRHYSKDVPSIAIKTGATARHGLQSFSRGSTYTKGLQILLELLNTNTKVICLDVRNRVDPNEVNVSENDALKVGDEHGGYKKDSKKSRGKVEDDERIQDYKKITACLKKELDTNFTGDRNVESLDCCLLSYLHFLAEHSAASKDSKNENNPSKSKQDNSFFVSKIIRSLCSREKDEAGPYQEGSLLKKISIMEQLSRDQQTYNVERDHDYVKIARMFAMTYYEHLTEFSRKNKLKFFTREKLEYENKPKLEFYEKSLNEDVYHENEKDIEMKSLKEQLPNNFAGMSMLKKVEAFEDALTKSEKTFATDEPVDKGENELLLLTRPEDSTDLTTEADKEKLKFPDDVSKAAFIVFRDEIEATASILKKLLESPNFYSLNVMNYIGKDQVYGIVQGTKAPDTTLPCLRVLKAAWIEVAKADYAAIRYKRLSKAILILQLLLACCVTVFSVAMETWAKEENSQVAHDWFRQAAFISSLVLSGLVTFDTILSPRSKWRHLRVACVSLESMIWRFRMRVGEFEEDVTTYESQEGRLLTALNGWRVKFMMGSNGPSLNFFRGRTITVSKSTCPQIYQVDTVEPSDELLKEKKSEATEIIKKSRSGYQRPSGDVEEQVMSNDDSKYGLDDLDDDHFSSLDGKKYVELRIESLISLYHGKFAKSETLNYVPDVIVILFGIVIALFSKWDYGLVVTILVAIFSNYNSWLEFKGRKEKQTLLSNAIDELRIKRSEWRGQNKFKALSKETTNELVMDTETLVMQVVSSWATAMNEIAQKQQKQFKDMTETGNAAEDDTSSKSVQSTPR